MEVGEERLKKAMIAAFFAFAAFLILIFAELLPPFRPLAADSPPRRERTAESVTVGGIDLNRADADALTALPGIGERTAERIVAWREENGGILSVRDLLFVEGIGEKTLDSILSFGEEP